MLPGDELLKQSLAQIGEAFTARETRANEDPLHGRSWQEITDEELDDVLGVYGFLGDDDLRFFLPAFMCRSLQTLESKCGGFELDHMLAQFACGPGFMHR